MRLTVTEQGRLAVRPRIEAAEACLTQGEAALLLGVGERMNARFADWADPAALRIHQFVGAVRAGELELEILPKIDTTPDTALVRRNLLAMLGVAEDLDIKDSEAITFWKSNEPILPALARLYCLRLADAVRRGLRQEYVLEEELLPHIRGKVHWATQAKVQATHRLEFHCVFDERSHDTPINRTLKAALRRAASILEGREDPGLVGRLRHVFDEVSDIPPPIEQVTRLRTDRLNRHLEALLSLAKLILGNRNPDLGRSAQGDHRSYAVVWDMNVLFERYIGRMTQKALAGRGDVRLQSTSTYLAQETQSERNAFLLTPDIVVAAWGKSFAVGDTKWKRLDGASPTLGVSEADAYQVLAYAHRFRTDLAVLIYPHHPTLRRPGMQRDFIVRAADGAAVTIRVMTVDLADLGSIERGLQEGMAVPIEESLLMSPDGRRGEGSAASP